jgi:hypothetical protein
MPLSHRLELKHTAFQNSFDSDGAQSSSLSTVSTAQLHVSNTRVYKINIVPGSGTPAAITAGGAGGTTTVFNTGASGTNAAGVTITTTYPLGGSGNPIFSGLLSFSAVLKADDITNAEKIAGGSPLDRLSIATITLRDSANVDYTFPPLRVINPADSAVCAWKTIFQSSGFTKITITFTAFSARANLTLHLAGA